MKQHGSKSCSQNSDLTQTMPIAYLWFSLAMLLCELILSWSMQVTVKIHLHLQGFLKAKQYGTLTFSYEDEPVYWRRIYTTIEASLRTECFKLYATQESPIKIPFVMQHTNLIQ